MTLSESEMYLFDPHKKFIQSSNDKINIRHSKTALKCVFSNHRNMVYEIFFKTMKVIAWSLGQVTKTSRREAETREEFQNTNQSESEIIK